jgi:phosphonate transport system substrate-binding protein
MAVISTLRQVFVKHSAELIAAILTGQETVKYKGMAFIPAPADSEYDYVRAMYRTIGYPEFSDFVGN